MWQMIWPAVIVIAANTLYHIVSKNTPEGVNPYISLSVSYFVCFIFTAILSLVTCPASAMLGEIKKLNATTVLLSLGMLGLEVGYIFLYRSGWKVSLGSLVCNTVVSVLLFVIGMMFFKEAVSPKQIIGIGVCIVGLLLVAK